MSFPATCRCLIIVLIINGLKAETRRFWEGESSVYHKGVTLSNVNSTNPANTVLIKGTLIEELDDNRANLNFQILFRNNTSEDIIHTWIFEFSIPFFLESAYQNQSLLYREDSSDNRFRLQEEGLRLYPVERDFYMFKDENRRYSSSLKLKGFRCQAFIGRTEILKGGEVEMVFDSQYYTFELYYEDSGHLYRLVIHSAKTDEGTFFFVSRITAVAIALILGFLALNGLFLLSLSMAKEIGFFPGSLLYVFLIPLSWLILLKYYSFSRSEIWWVISGIGVFYLELWAWLGKAVKKITKKEWKVQFCPFVLCALLFALACYLLAYFYPSSIFWASIFPYISCLFVDISFGLEKGKQKLARFWWFITLLELISQIWFTFVYALLFNIKYLEAPIFIFWKLLYLNFSVFVAVSIFIGILAVIECHRCRCERGGSYAI